MKMIYYVRHGESVGNAEGKLVGGKWDTPLTPLGEQQALAAADLLRDKAIDLIVASPLQRARRTADIIAGAIDHKDAIVTNALLEERDFGSASGKPRDEAFELLDSGKAEGLESVADFYDRMSKAVDWLKSLPAERVMVVGHAGCAKMIMAVVEGTAAADFLQYKSLDNAAIYEFAL